MLELVRRIESALHPHARRLSAEGPASWAVLQSGEAGVSDPLVGLLGAMAELDRLGDVLASWAHDRSGIVPEATVDSVTAEVAGRLDRLGVPHEARERPPRGRS